MEAVAGRLEDLPDSVSRGIGGDGHGGVVSPLYRPRYHTARNLHEHRCGGQRHLKSEDVRPYDIAFMSVAGTLWTNGYIQITVPDGIESKKGLLDATLDENTVVFTSKNNELVDQIKSKIEELMSQQRTGHIINQLSPADEKRRYKELLDDGVITQEEFEQKKKTVTRIIGA